MTLRSPDVEEQNRLIKQRRVVDSGKEDKVGMRFALWLRDEWGRADVGSMLENASKVGAEKWAVEYIKHHIDKGLRGDSLKRVQSEIALAFRNGGGDERIWKSVRVDQMVQSGLRNNNEQRLHVKTQLAIEKYPWNFGVMVEILKQSGAMDGFFEEGMTAKEVDKMAHALMLLLMFELGPRMSNITGENSKQKDLPGPREDGEKNKKDGKEGKDDNENDFPEAKEMSHAMVWSDWEFEIITLDKEGNPLWEASGAYLTEWWVGGALVLCGV
jgi:hypothetical protein